METAYLKKCFGNTLTQALAEVARVQPNDPIEYLAHWLYHYRNITKAEEKKKQEELQLQEEVHDSNSKEAKATATLKEGSYQIQQKCEKHHQELPSTSVSSDQTPARQEDLALREEKSTRQEVHQVSHM
ncbi:DPY30 domain-containing protein 2 [Rattus rattus]|uniref:DPY30 domain-containing protein 2 n=1 Tax=Rattus rattus TaxID=10117 RepID=UPI0013F34A06|nr:DPY30 domain-containing protein 2 [Rattus rattus]